MRNGVPSSPMVVRSPRTLVGDASLRQPPAPLLPLPGALIVAIFAGWTFDLGFPSANLWPLAFVGIALTLVSLVGRRAGTSALVAFLFGVVFYLRHVSWTALYLGPLPWSALSALQALFIAGGGVLITLAYRWLPVTLPLRWHRLTVLPLCVAGLWCVREVVTGCFPYGGFPWARAALSQSDSPFTKTVSWLGGTGLSFLMVALVAGLIEWLRIRGWRDLRTLLPAAVTLTIAVALPAWPTTVVGTLRVASVQGNGPAGYFDEQKPGEVLRAQLAATSPILDTPHIGVLVWPESGAEYDPTSTPQAAALFTELSDRIGAPILLNAITRNGTQYFNSSILWQANVGAIAQYDKRNPVPFGEYVPDRWFFRLLAPNLVDLIQREYAPGTRPPVITIGTTTAGLAICFDVIYDSVVWDAARRGAELYLLQSNNADFRGTEENQQQSAIVRMRAIETGRSVVNVSTVGESQVYDSSGESVASIAANTAGALVTDVQLRRGLTPAVAVGGTVEGVTVWGSLVVLVMSVWYRREPRQNRRP